ncbi:MAG: hypothetical protein ACKON7_07115 [Planctomycetaceae bacterium]
MNLLHLGRRGRLIVAVVVTAAAGPFAARAADVPAALSGSGLAIVPADAAFLSATLRAREQYDRFVTSNAYAALRALPAVKRAFESVAEQRTMPGNPLSMVDSFLQLPENAQAVDLLADMVATDTFVYGEPSCAAFVQLVRKLSAVVQALGRMGARATIDDEMEMPEDVDDGGGEAGARPTVRVHRCQVGADVAELSPDAMLQRMLVETLVDNIDLVVVPDVVWGFKTTMPDAARAQVARLEALAKATLGGEGAAASVARKQVAGGDFLVITVRGESLPWGEFERECADVAGDIDGFDDVFARLRKLDVCLALGVVGGRVIVSFGDSPDHLGKLAGGGAAGRLLELPALAPVLAHADKPLTAVSYLSTGMVTALAQSAEDLKQPFAMLEEQLDDAGLPEEAVEDGRQTVERFAAALAARLPEPGAWTAFSFLADAGYEGYAWNWSKNQPFDGGRRLDLLEHAGGAPVAVLVSRLKSDPTWLDDVTDFAGGLWSLFGEHGPGALEGEAGDRRRELMNRFGPLWSRLADIVRGKLMPALADGQVGLVLDGTARTKKPQRDLPASAEPLPVPEPAIVLPLKDAKLFKEGLNDLFALGDETVATVRALDPAALPPGYAVPDPEKAKVEAGTVWSFALPDSGLDDQIRPAIGVGEKAAVFSLVTKQAARLLGAAKLETGAQLSTFEEPLAGAAAVDVAGVVDLLKPWVVYATRYGSVHEREGLVDADAELTAADENERVKEALKHVDVVADVAKCLRAAVAETGFRDGALVTHWRNIIRDLPKK